MKSILKKASCQPSPKHASLQWDEDNLKHTEQEKAAFASIKINEPKTPFIHYKMETDEILGSSLNEIPELPRHMHHEPCATMQEEDTTHPTRRLSMSLHHMPGHSEGHGWESSEDDACTTRHLPQQPSSSLARQDKPTTMMQEEMDPESHHQYVHDHFEELRSKHYRMKEAIREAKSLLRKEGLTDSEAELDHEQSNDSHGFVST